MSNLWLYSLGGNYERPAMWIQHDDGGLEIRISTWYAKHVCVLYRYTVKHPYVAINFLHNNHEEQYSAQWTVLYKTFMK